MFIVPKIYIKRSCVDIIGNYHQMEENKKKIKKKNLKVLKGRYK